MSYQLDTARLATALSEARGRRKLRDIALEIGGVSASTLCRIENGKSPDLATFLALCEWLDSPPSEFINSDSIESPPPKNRIWAGKKGNVVEVKITATSEEMAGKFFDVIETGVIAACKFDLEREWKNESI